MKTLMLASALLLGLRHSAAARPIAVERPA